MRKFMALLKKDFYISKKSLLQPIWITLGFYGTILFFFLIALISGKFKMIGIPDIDSTEMDSISPTINYVVNYIAVTISGFLAILSSIMISQSALNEDFKRNFELFHRTQPISIWLKSLSKFIMAIVGGWAVLVVISLFNFTIIGTIFGIWHQFVPKMAFMAFAQASVIYMKAIIIIASLGFLASALFKDKAFLTGLAVLMAIQVLFIMVNTMFNMHLPLPFELISKLLFLDATESIANTTEMEALSNIIHNNWQKIIFNMQTIYQILVSGALFVVSTYIYKSKEIKI